MGSSQYCFRTTDAKIGNFVGTPSITAYKAIIKFEIFFNYVLIWLTKYFRIYITIIILLKTYFEYESNDIFFVGYILYFADQIYS
jgi:hypothetical protein